MRTLNQINSDGNFQFPVSNFGHRGVAFYLQLDHACEAFYKAQTGADLINSSAWLISERILILRGKEALHMVR